MGSTAEMVLGIDLRRSSTVIFAGAQYQNILVSL